MPDSSDRMKDYKGRLVIVTPSEFIDDFQTSIGETEVIIADVVVIDEKNPAESKELSSTVFFGKAIVPYLKRKLDKGEKALGRYTQREATSKGKSGAWALQKPTPEEMQLGLKYLESVQTNPFANAEDSDSATQ
jgi:hypothetical protein